MRRFSDKPEPDMVPIDGEIRRTSPSGKAILFYDGSREVWLPISLIEISSDNKSVLVPEWMAHEKGLI